MDFGTMLRDVALVRPVLGLVGFGVFKSSKGFCDVAWHSDVQVQLVQSQWRVNPQQRAPVHSVVMVHWVWSMLMRCWAPSFPRI